MTIAIETFTDADYQQDFVADPVIPLADYSIRMMVRKHAADATVYLDLTTNNLGIFKIADTTDEVGRYIVSMTYRQLQAIPVGNYVFSVIAYNGVNRFEIGRGTMTHAAGPTRWV